MEKKNVLSVKNLSKIYSKNGSATINALNNLNLEVKEGEIFGLLGPNGAGKSTFINILAGTVIKTSGTVNVWGFDLDKNPRQVRASIGIVPQEVNLDPFFSPRKLLELLAGMYGIKKKDRITDDILKLVALDKQSDSYARSLSGGMKRRLLIAKALVHQPPILFLDEPTASLDPETGDFVRSFIEKISKEKKMSILLASHNMDEVKRLCKNVLMMNNGIIIDKGTPDHLIEKHGKKNLEEVFLKLNRNNNELE